MVEVACEPREDCSNNEEVFKGMFARDLSSVALVAPYTMDKILPRLQGCATAVAKTCTGGKNNDSCGERWYTSEFDGTADMNTQLNALSIFTSNLIEFENKFVAVHSSNANGTASGTATNTTRASGTSKTSSVSATSTGGASSLAFAPLAVPVALLAGFMTLL